MKISRLKIENFRGISTAELFFPDHGVLIGDNNTGKSTILEAINLAMGPDRLNRRPPIDEHDFYKGAYMPVAPSEPAITLPGVEPADTPEEDPEAPTIKIEVVVTDLNDEQIAHFNEYLEPWNTSTSQSVQPGDIDMVDEADTEPAIRVLFEGKYDPEEDDFDGQTYFSKSIDQNEPRPKKFSKRDKQICGFLYLRALRTGSRALSLEHGSLLDIILRLKELRPNMWEDTIQTLADIDVASNKEIGITGVLETLNASLAKYVPKEWGAAPRLKVSSLSRDHLRKVITAFMSTGADDHIAPFYRQGTGTINMLVLALLSQIAEDKQNVIFAMEEPETAIPPYAQKRIIHELRKLSAQSLVTSHSPYVLEEYATDNTIVLTRAEDGGLQQNKIELPDVVKPKAYRREFRTRFCEGLLARRVLIVEGRTEADAMPEVARHLSELDPAKYISFEAMGLTVIDAGSDNKVGPLGAFYRNLGKTAYGLCDVQDEATAKAIEAQLDEFFMHPETGFEELVLNNTTDAALLRHAMLLDWPPHLLEKFPDPTDDPKLALKAYFKHTKGDGSVARFLADCSAAEIPEWIRATCERLSLIAGGVSVNTEAEPDVTSEDGAATVAEDDGAFAEEFSDDDWTDLLGEDD